jgi:hypothetical protein
MGLEAQPVELGDAAGRRRGFTSVGPTARYVPMQAVEIVDDHVVDRPAAVRPVIPRRLGQSPQPSWAGPPPLPGKCWPEQWMAKTCESLVTCAATPIPATSAVIAAASAMPARSRSWWVMISPRVVPGWSRSRTTRYGRPPI